MMEYLILVIEEDLGGQCVTLSKICIMV